MHFGAAYAGYRGISLVAISSLLAAAALARAGSRSPALDRTLIYHLGPVEPRLVFALRRVPVALRRFALS